MLNELYIIKAITAEQVFTKGIEGPAFDKYGNYYCVNFAREHTIGKITPDKECSEFVTLSGTSIGNGIRFDSKGNMFIADYVNHNILKVDMFTKEISVYCHEDSMNQPNDIAIDSNDIIYASDPNWPKGTGQIWRIDRSGAAVCLETNMGTTNGIEVSPDERTLYVNESVQRKIWAYDLNNGNVSNKRLFFEFNDFGLDGMRCDILGNLYVTRYGKGSVVVLSPQGEFLREINLDGLNCTNLDIGGKDGCDCYVTVADKGNVQGFRVEHPGRAWAMNNK